MNDLALLDQFALAAMRELIAKLPIFDNEGEHGVKATHEQLHEIREGVAESAYDYAECMLARRTRISKTHS